MPDTGAVRTQTLARSFTVRLSTSPPTPPPTNLILSNPGDKEKGKATAGSAAPANAKEGTIERKKQAKPKSASSKAFSSQAASSGNTSLLDTSSCGTSATPSDNSSRGKKWTEGESVDLLKAYKVILTDRENTLGTSLHMHAEFVHFGPDTPRLADACSTSQRPFEALKPVLEHKASMDPPFLIRSLMPMDSLVTTTFPDPANGDDATPASVDPFNFSKKTKKRKKRDEEAESGPALMSTHQEYPVIRPPPTSTASISVSSGAQDGDGGSEDAYEHIYSWEG
ncbi:hypothetical protein BDK51DRAFT_50206 [Blyttiomyces helicus]|uniref:Uncharacterized protein n=1 Tax=Blyttiomyces helicus TaxID=388810 RepID=A0A4P9WMC1_9FUNG|nr:hypothetical protein BDK51DRAFT_50206 [Blyttiomyces helicus]|eukprot:RKO94221.1 hypothetical protein BDK51DRAFT_50206 [Blyttiomyces helicus]